MSTETEAIHHHDAHEEHEHGGPAVMLRTLIALLFLTILTVGASYIDFGSGNVVIALFIATIKASLVALFFMHLRWEKPVNGIIAVAGFLFLGIFLMFDFIDFDTRGNLQPTNFNGMPTIQGPAPVAPAAPPAAPGAAAPAKKE
jgi:cytochrome c oxidase subunit 4